MQGLQNVSRTNVTSVTALGMWYDITPGEAKIQGKKRYIEVTKFPSEGWVSQLVDILLFLRMVSTEISGNGPPYNGKYFQSRYNRKDTDRFHRQICERLQWTPGSRSLGMSGDIWAATCTRYCISASKMRTRQHPLFATTGGLWRPVSRQKFGAWGVDWNSLPTQG